MAARMIYGCQWRHVREQHITTVTVLKETGLRHIDTYLERRRIRWAGHVARMGWNRTPRKLLSAWAYQEDGRSWGRPMKRWAESFEEDLKGASIPVSKWHELAQDKGNLKNRRRIEEKQGKEEAETTVESAGIMRDWMRRKMRKLKI